MKVTINIAEWILYFLVIWLALGLADNTLALYKRYLEWKIKKIKISNKDKTFSTLTTFLIFSFVLQNNPFYSRIK